MGKVRSRIRMRDLGGRAALRLQASANIEQYWAAAQDLITAAAPCSTRWLCLRPLQMESAMLLLRETSPQRRGQTQHTGGAGDDDLLLRAIFNRHPAALHFRRNVRASLLHLGEEENRSLEASRNALGRQRWKYGAAFAFWRQKRLEGLLFLHRREAEGDFTATELTQLRQMQPHLEAALGRIIRHRRHQAHQRMLGEILKPLPLPMVICDHKLQVITETAEGLEARAVWAAGDRTARRLNGSRKMPLPADLAGFCRNKMQVWEKADARERTSLESEETELRHPEIATLRVHLRLVRQRRFPLIKPVFVLRFKSRETPSGASDHAARANFASLTALTAAERELALLLCRGHDNAAIAQQLGKSIHTVKAQLRSIFAKLEVKSRSKLISLLVRQTGAILALLPSELTPLF